MTRDEAIVYVTDGAARHLELLDDGETPQGYPDEGTLLNIAIQTLTGLDRHWKFGPTAGRVWRPDVIRAALPDDPFEGLTA